MTVFIVREFHRGPGETIGVYSTKEAAIAAVRDHLPAMQHMDTLFDPPSEMVLARWNEGLSFFDIERHEVK